MYDAFDTVLERTVETLNRDLPDDQFAEMQARFVREAKSAGRLIHANIVTVSVRPAQPLRRPQAAGEQGQLIGKSDSLAA